MAFATEFLEAKHEFAADVSDAELERGRDGLRAFIANQTQASPATRKAAAELVLLSPAGLKADWPQPEVYRKRLTTSPPRRRCCSTLDLRSLRSEGDGQ